MGRHLNAIKFARSSSQVTANSPIRVNVFIKGNASRPCINLLIRTMTHVQISAQREDATTSRLIVIKHHSSASIDSCRPLWRWRTFIPAIESYRHFSLQLLRPFSIFRISEGLFFSTTYWKSWNNIGQLVDIFYQYITRVIGNILKFH